MPNHLAELARAIRQSTLTRLRLVPDGLENWRIDEEAMSFADTAQHLLDSDDWLLDTLRRGVSQHMTGRAKSVEIARRQDYETLLERLAASGDRRISVIEGLDDSELERVIRSADGGGDATVWWTVVRGTLEHEAHHRGQVVAYLRALRQQKRPG